MMAGMFDEKKLIVTITEWQEFNGFMGKSIVMNFKDGKTLRCIQFSENSRYKDRSYIVGDSIRGMCPAGSRIMVTKTGSGKYAGYRIY